MGAGWEEVGGRCWEACVTFRKSSPKFLFSHRRAPALTIFPVPRPTREFGGLPSTGFRGEEAEAGGHREG